MKRILLVVLVMLGLNTIQAQQSQQPYFCCDSITYWTDQSQGFNIGLDTSGIVHDVDSIVVNWAVCNSSMCYSGSGMYAYFSQILTTDTIKVGYIVDLYKNGVLIDVCSLEEWLIFDQNSFSWVLFNMMPTSINELTFNRINNGKIYDLTGKELREVPVGVMYIRNNKLYIKTK